MTAESDAITNLLRALAPEARAISVEDVAPLTGGQSADTYRVRGRWQLPSGEQPLDVVVRRVRPDGLLAPYDVEREQRILVALRDSPVPVPAVYGCDPTGEYLGDACLVTAYVQGQPLPFFGVMTSPDDARLPSYFSALAMIHSLDWASFGLEFLDESADALDGEIDRSQARLDLHGGAGGFEEDLIAWLRASKPSKTAKALLHGDPNLANYLFLEKDVVAVIDWELALVGDPRIDLGFFAAVQTVLGEVWELDAKSYYRGYATANPALDLQCMDYFEALGLFRTAGFLHGARRLRGADMPEQWQRLRRRAEEIMSTEHKGDTT